MAFPTVSPARVMILLLLIGAMISVYIFVFPHHVSVGERFTKTADTVIMDFVATVNTKKVIATGDEKFLSVCLTWRVGARDRWEYNPTTEQRIIALTKALSPAYIRIGGTPSDFVEFNGTSNQYGGLTVEITNTDIDRINHIAERAGLHVLFTLSVLKRYDDGSWDSSNPFKIVKYVAKKGYKFGWELGNESNHLKKFNVTVSAEQLARDFSVLRKKLDSSFPASIQQFLVGPDVTQQNKKTTRQYLSRFLMKGKDAIDAVTWHHYYVKSKDCTLAQFYVPEVLDTLLQQINMAKGVIDPVAPNLPKWLGETSSASGGGAFGISDRYVAGFMWLDKLGIAAQQGYKVVIRQALFYGNYSLVDEDLEPNPDYWLSVLYKKMFGVKVLAVKNQGHHSSRLVRMYAHCTSTRYRYNKEGAVSLIAMNLNSEKSVRIMLGTSLQHSGVHEYLFTPEGSITSRKMNLNGELLKMGPNSTFPPLQPRRVEAGVGLIVPPLTYAFYVVPDAHAPAC